MFKLIFFSLFIHLAVGGLLPLLFISLDEIGTMFFRLISMLSAAFLFFALLAQPFDYPSSAAFPGWTGNLVIGLMIFSVVALLAGSIWLKQLRKSYVWLALLSGAAALFLSAAWYPVMGEAAQASLAAKAISFAGSAFLLGSVMTAMITGHWYLVNHRLTIQPLKTAALLFLAATVLRVLFVIGLMAANAFSESVTATITHNLLSLSGEGMIFWARVAIGLVGPFIFGIMIYETVKLRSTQSATGILYAAVVMVFIGEAFSKFLWFFTGIPV